MAIMFLLIPDPPFPCCSGQLCCALQGHQAPVTHVTINERSNQVISLSKDKIIKVALVAV